MSLFYTTKGKIFSMDFNDEVTRKILLIQESRIVR